MVWFVFNKRKVDRFRVYTKKWFELLKVGKSHETNRLSLSHNTDEFLGDHTATNLYRAKTMVVFIF
jgi:hypothetical protein